MLSVLCIPEKGSCLCFLEKLYEEYSFNDFLRAFTGFHPVKASVTLGDYLGYKKNVPPQFHKNRLAYRVRTGLLQSL